MLSYAIKDMFQYISLNSCSLLKPSKLRKKEMANCTQLIKSASNILAGEKCIIKYVSITLLLNL